MEVKYKGIEEVEKYFRKITKGDLVVISQLM